MRHRESPKRWAGSDVEQAQPCRASSISGGIDPELQHQPVSRQAASKFAKTVRPRRLYHHPVFKAGSSIAASLAKATSKQA